MSGPRPLRMADLDLAGKRVLIREDLNVPVANGAVTSDARIRASLPTIRMAMEKGARVILMSHLGRPEEGKFEPEFSLAPVAHTLSELLGRTAGHPLFVLQCLALEAASRSGFAFPVKRSVVDFSWDRVTRLNLRWIAHPPSKAVHCRLLSVEATENRQVSLKDPTLTIGSQSLLLPMTLATGDALELDSDRILRRYDQDNQLRETTTLQAPAPTLTVGSLPVRLDASDFSGSARIQVSWVAQTFSHSTQAREEIAP